MTTIESKLTLITGLHIGGADDGMKIGGVDSPVMKREIFCNTEGVVGFDTDNKKVREPYIAGSSLKGKVRSLLEHYFRLIDPMGEGNVVDIHSTFGEVKYIELIIKLFGQSAGNDVLENEINITRAIFRDCFITQDVRKAYLENKIEFFEVKYENVIDRKTGTTKNGGLRQVERVISAIEFDFTMSIRVFENDNEKLFKNTILLGLKLLELDTLGGNGRRGYGRVRFDDIEANIQRLRIEIDNALNQD